MTAERPTTRVGADSSGLGRATGLQLDRGGRSAASNIDTALERNRSFAAAGGHQGAVVFPNLRLFVITCLDPRVDPAHFLGLGLSDAMVLRNAGGRVTAEVINDVAFIGQLAEAVMPDGPLFEVAVIHHNQCATGALADDAFRQRYAERIGATESAVREHAVLDPVETVARVFPSVEILAEADLARLAMPGARIRGLCALVAALAHAEIVLDAGSERARTRRQLLTLPGIGPWTAEYIAMRAMRDPDAFLAQRATAICEAATRDRACAAVPRDARGELDRRGARRRAVCVHAPEPWPLQLAVVLGLLFRGDRLAAL